MIESNRPPGQSLHRRLAGARAYLAAGRKNAEARVFDAAIEAASKGIDELGKHYRLRGARDDTGVAIHLAEEQLTRGDDEAAAQTMLQVLEARLVLYAKAHPDVLE